MTEYGDLSSDYHAHFTRNPNDCVLKGVERRLGDLPDPSRETADDEVREAGQLLARAMTLAHGKELDFDERLDIDLAVLSLEAEIHRKTYTLNGKPHATQLPRASDDIGDGIFFMFVNDPRPEADRLADITRRIEQVPDYLESALERLDTPVDRWVGIDVEKVSGLPSLFETMEGWANDVEWPDRRRLSTARAAAETALASYAARLEKMPTTRQLHVGTETARRIVELRGIDKPLEDLHGLAREFLAETSDSIERLRAGLARKYELGADASTQSVHDFLNDRYRVRAGDDYSVVLDRYRAELDRVVQFVRERDLFPIFPDQELTILQTPPFMAPSIPAGAMTSPPPFRDGVRKSLVYLTLSPELLDEHTELGIPVMIIHEGIPGHHLQLATASKHPSIIRRHFDAMEQAEGWTTMLEDYMLDIGYRPELTDEIRFCAKRDISRIGARVAIDLFFMTGDRSFLDVGVDADVSPTDPFEAAGNLLVSVTGFTPGRVQAELNWYSQERGYPLSYLTGNRLVWDLKRDTKKAQSDRSSADVDRAFHRTFLEAGNMPVTFLRRVFRHRGLVD